MSEATDMNISLGSGNEKEAPRRYVSALTNDDLIDWIKSQELDAETTNKLIGMSKRYPSHALKTFKKNFQVMLMRARSELSKQKHIQQQRSQDEQKETIQQEIEQDEFQG